MFDREFLMWIHDRLACVYGESELLDYMHKLRAIIRATSKDRITPSCGTTNSLKELRKIL